MAKSNQLMATQDKCVSIAPYFKVQSGKLPAFKKLCEQFVERAKTEPGCLYYGFGFDGDLVFCREGYADADAALAHLQNVGAIIAEALKISTLARLELHGTESELAKLRSATDNLNPQFFVIEYGFRK
jgi:quinol monooxygenase YgiN